MNLNLAIMAYRFYIATLAHALTLLATTSRAEMGQLGFKIARPPASTWSRTNCGHAGSQGVPAGPYVQGVDFPGNDIKPCGSDGCVLNSGSSHLDCESKCNSTQGCVAYVFAPLNCSRSTGPICWTKSSASGNGKKKVCRNSRKMGHPGVPATDIPSQWASEVSAETAPLKAYPRPQMVRTTNEEYLKNRHNSDFRHLRDVGDNATWINLNGLWEWEASEPDSDPPFGRTLTGSILVPFPVESCLSGVAPARSADIVMDMWYRLKFTTQNRIDRRMLLHFGAVDWQSRVYINQNLLGNHTGGYSGFSFDITSHLAPAGQMNELLVYAHDPSDMGAQPNGKQRISAIDNPSGDTYTPSSGIWQTVWLEAVPHKTYISDLKINQASLDTVVVTASSAEEVDVTMTVLDSDGKKVTSVSGKSGHGITLRLQGAPKLWSPDDPNLYDLVVETLSDRVLSYFGLRTFQLDGGAASSGDAAAGRRPLLNGKFTFLAGFLDQSWWPDGQYTAPTDEALAYDIEAVPLYGLNMIRLHQKVNPERWYYHADRIGVVVFQDMVQKYHGATQETVPFFVEDMKLLISQRGNHPCIVQYETFNEGDCWSVFTQKPYDVSGIVALARQLDPTRLVDTDSGGLANDKHIGDVNDIHSYPYPGDPQPSGTQYAMVGEFGGIGAFVPGKEWKPASCHTYLHVETPADEAAAYIRMAATLESRVDHISASVYTQTTDVELECDGFLNYDRTSKFTEEDIKKVRAANQAIINASRYV